MADACSFASSMLGAVLGALWSLESVVAPAGVSVWNALAPPLVAAFPENHGTGFFVNARGDFVSAHHVAGACALVAIETHEGVLVGRPVAGSEALDITVIRVDAVPPAHAVLPRPGAPVTDAFVQVVSTERCGGLASQSRTAARARSVPLPPPGRVVIRTPRPIVSGNSGSPIVDANGVLVGMLVARATGTGTGATDTGGTGLGGTGIGVPAAAIAEVLTAAGIPFEAVPRPPPLAAPPFAPATAYTFPVDCFAP